VSQPPEEYSRLHEEFYRLWNAVDDQTRELAIELVVRKRAAAKENAPETAFLERFSNLLLEFMMSSLVAHAVAKDDPDFEDFRRRVSTLVAENPANA
jgi:hypothetical protein